MNTNLIDQQIIDSFFKYYKKDVNSIYGTSRPK